MNKTGKTLKGVVFVAFIAVFLFFCASQKIYAYAGFLDIVIDPSNLVQNTVSATANPVTAVSSSVTAAMTTAEKIKEYLLDPVARAIVKTIIQRLTAQTVNWINSGFQGNPAYVTNPGQFFLNVGDDTASTFLSATSLNQLCSPFKAQVRLALVKNYINNNQNFSCTLSKIKNNYEQFTQDFSQGGWEGWFEVTQNSQNNPYGAYIQAQNQLAIRVGNQKTNYQNQITQGKGFLSFQKCKESDTVTAANIDQWSTEFQRTLKIGDCLGTKETVTPGSVIETQLENALGTGIKQLELTRSFDEIVSALVTQLFTRVVGGGVGLRGDGTPIPVPDMPPVGLPFIVLRGDNPTYVQIGTRYLEPKASAFDNTDGDISDRVVITGTVNASVAGTYTITYNVKNSRGVSATPVTRTIIVEDLSILPGPAGGEPGGDPGTPASEPPGLGTMCGDIAAARNALATTSITHDQMAGVLSSTAIKDTASGWGLLNKTIGNRCDTSAGPVSCDIMFNGPTCLIYDVFSGAGSEANPIDKATPQCSFAGSMSQSRFVDIGGGNGNISSATCVSVTMADGSTMKNGVVTSPPVVTPGGTGTITGTIDPSSVTVVNAPAGVMSWPETTQITNADFSGDWRFDFSKKDGVNRWPDQPGGPGISSSDTIQYTVWLFLKINGGWVGSGFIQMWHDRIGAGGSGATLFSQLPTNWYYGSAWTPMTPAVTLKAGDQIGFMVTSGNSRNGGVPNFKERSNIVLVTLR